MVAENNYIREKIFPGSSIFRRHSSTSLSLRFLKMGHGPRVLESLGMLIKPEGLDHDLLSQSKQLLVRYCNNLEVVNT